MGFNRPSLAVIIERNRTDIESGLEGADAHLRRTIEDVTAVAFGGAVHLLHGHLVWLSRQLLPDTAEKEFLDRHASIRDRTRKAASRATGMVPITGTPTAVCPAGTVWQRNDGVRYVQDADQTIGAGGSATASVTAELPGAAGNALAGVRLALVSPVVGITGEATLTASISGGANTETDEELRARVLAAWRSPPRGGGPGDYVAWAREVTGVTRAWEYPAQFGAGTVGLTFVRDNDTPSILPDAIEVAAVQAHLVAKAPIQTTGHITVWAPVAKAINVTLHVEPNTLAVRDAVAAELAELFHTEAEPGGTIPLSHIHEAISRVPAETDHTLAAPAADLICLRNEVAVLGTVTFI